MTTVMALKRRNPEDEWSARPPEGWEPVAEVCRRLFRSLPSMVTRIDNAITSEIPEFKRPESVFTAPDMNWSITRNVATFLHGVAERRIPTEEEVSFRRLVGERTAKMGFGLQPLITSFHVAYRELWSMLVEQAEAIGGKAPSLILVGGSTIWEWMLSTSNAVAEGYQSEIARREAHEARTAAHFIEALTRDPSSEECIALARELGFRPDGNFRVLALEGPRVSERARALVQALQRKGGNATVGLRGSRVLVVVQGIGAAEIDDAMHSSIEDISIGVGLEGKGLEGAAESISEAECALKLGAARRRICRFEDDWLPAILLSHRRSAERMLEPGIRVARLRPQLAEAVRIFAESKLSVAESARRLFISQNSLRYRLTRWRDLTGWDPWTYEGLSRSMLALGLGAGIRLQEEAQR